MFKSILDSLKYGNNVDSRRREILLLKSRKIHYKPFQLESSHATQVFLFAPSSPPPAPAGGGWQGHQGIAPLHLGRRLLQDDPTKLFRPTSPQHNCFLEPQVYFASFVLFVDNQNFRSIMNVDEARGFLDLDLTLTLYWEDTGVKIINTSRETVTINPDQDNILGHIWCPDVVVDQAMSFSSRPKSR